MKLHIFLKLEWEPYANPNTLSIKVQIGPLINSIPCFVILAVIWFFGTSHS